MQGQQSLRSCQLGRLAVSAGTARVVERVAAVAEAAANAAVATFRTSSLNGAEDTTLR